MVAPGAKGKDVHKVRCRQPKEAADVYALSNTCITKFPANAPVAAAFPWAAAFCEFGHNLALCLDKELTLSGPPPFFFLPCPLARHPFRDPEATYLSHDQLYRT